MKAENLLEYIKNDKLDETLKSGCAVSPVQLEEYKKRLAGAIQAFCSIYGNGRDLSLFSVGGRSEISGNHTDHNNGKVVAAAINLDIIAVAAASENGVVRIKSEGFDEDTVTPDVIDAPEKNVKFTSASIIAGMEKAFLDRNYAVGGFDAYTTSNVLKGLGLSSSAVFEVMTGNILNHLYNNGKIENIEIAKMAQFAENVYFGKPCGLMDQTACAVGGFISIDFKNPNSPVIEKLDFDLSHKNYTLCIVNTGGNHADLNEDYASVPAEMKSVASYFGKKTLREVDFEVFLSNITGIRKELGDRHLLRAIHFYNENKRVDKIVAALKTDDWNSFLMNISASGDSSYKYLQNVYTNKNISEQGLSTALCLSEEALSGIPAAFRVHGGGFAGTIQAFIPSSKVNEYSSYMDSIFGPGSCQALQVRRMGAVKLI